MRVSEVSKRYARALYELSKKEKNNDRVFSELRILKSVFEADKTIQDFISSPLVTPDKKVIAIKAALNKKSTEEVANTILLLAEKNRLNIFSEMVAAFEEISDQDHGVTRGSVRSATALSPEARKQIEETVNRVTGKRVILNFTEDSKILGGMVAQVGGWTFDDSLEAHIKRLSEDLNRRAN